MSDSFILSPSANPITVSATYTTQERAYVQQWYVDTKEAGETVEAFLKRLTIANALEHRRALIQNQIREDLAAVVDPANNTAISVRDQLTADFSQVKTELGV